MGRSSRSGGPWSMKREDVAHAWRNVVLRVPRSRYAQSGLVLYQDCNKMHARGARRRGAPEGTGMHGDARSQFIKFQCVVASTEPARTRGRPTSFRCYRRQLRGIQLLSACPRKIRKLSAIPILPPLPRRSFLSPKAASCEEMQEGSRRENVLLTGARSIPRSEGQDVLLC